MTDKIRQIGLLLVRRTTNITIRTQITTVLFLGLVLSRGVLGQSGNAVDHSDCFLTGLKYPNLYKGSIYVCPSDVSSDPKWDDRWTQRPPIEVHQAVQRSRRVLREFEPNEKSWQLDDVTLMKVDDVHWVYRVGWTVPKADKELAFVVTMAGRVIRPELESRP